MSQDDTPLLNAFHVVPAPKTLSAGALAGFDFLGALQTTEGQRRAVDWLQAYLMLLQPTERLAVLQVFCEHCGAWRGGQHVCQQPSAPTWQEMGAWPY